MGLLSTIFGSSSALKTAGDVIKNGVDMLDEKKFTEEELSKAMLEYTSTWLEIQKTIASENSIRSITRRIIAWMIIGLFLILIMASCIIYKFDNLWSSYILTIIETSKLGWLTTGVGVFYFGYYGVAKIYNNK